jgi:hypothetical protein
MVMACFKAVFQHVPGGMEENHENFTQCSE